MPSAVNVRLVAGVMMRRAMAVVALVGLSVGCGGSDGQEWPARAKVQSCASGWQPTGPLETDPPLGPEVMAWADGILYQAAHGKLGDPSSAGLVAVPADGGAATRVADDWAVSLFVDGDNLIYSHDTRLMRVPRAGGTPEVVLADPATSQQVYVQAHLLDDTHYVWATADSNSTLWRMPRAGGTAVSMGPTGVSVSSHFALVTDGVIATGPVTLFEGRTYDAVVVPFDGGTPRRLGEVWMPFLADGTGVLWNAFLYSDHKGRQAYEIRRTPADGGEAIALSAELPLELAADWAAPDGQGGYLLSGIEYFDDMAMHRSVFDVAADGHATRIACDPSANAPIVESAAMSPEALYLSAWSTDGWTIVKVPRQ
jgi:hypothetical protein